MNSSRNHENKPGAKPKPYVKRRTKKTNSAAYMSSDKENIMVSEEEFVYGSKNQPSVSSYGETIRDIRVACGFTQGFVAENLGVTPGYISKVENDRTTLSLRLLKKYAELTGVTIDSIVGHLDSDYKETAIDNALITRIADLSEEDKERLLNIISAVFD